MLMGAGIGQRTTAITVWRERCADPVLDATARALWLEMASCADGVSQLPACDPRRALAARAADSAAGLLGDGPQRTTGGARSCASAFDSDHRRARPQAWAGAANHKSDDADPKPMDRAVILRDASPTMREAVLKCDQQSRQPDARQPDGRRPDGANLTAADLTDANLTRAD